MQYCNPTDPTLLPLTLGAKPKILATIFHHAPKSKYFQELRTRNPAIKSFHQIKFSNHPTRPTIFDFFNPLPAVTLNPKTHRSKGAKKPFQFLKMDMSEVARKLGLSESKQLIRKAAELRRLADIQFDSSIIGVGEICKAVICLEIAASRMEVIFDRQAAIKLSGVSEKAYYRSFNLMQNGIGVKNKLDIRELAIQFGCVRLIPFVHKGLSLYKDRFLTSLPPSRRGSTDFTRPVFTAVAFYLCAKRHKLRVDKFKLIELAGTSESEFSNVSTSMIDLCFDVFGIAKEKKDSRKIKGNRELIDALPEKRRLEDGGYSSSDGEEPSAYKKRKQMEKHDHDEWKSAVLKSNKLSKTEAAAKRTKSKQTTLDFLKRVPETTAKAS